MSDDATPVDVLDDEPVDHDLVGTTGGSATRIIALSVGAVLIGLVALFAFGGGIDDQNEASRLLGRRVPAVEGTAVDGRLYDIDDHRGEWVLVNFFGTWCPPCVAEHPDLVALEEWGAENERLSLVSVAFNEEPDKVQAFFDERGGSWPVLDDAGLSIDFQISMVPESFLIAPSGLVFRHYIGGLTAEEITTALAENDLPVSSGGVGTGGG